MGAKPRRAWTSRRPLTSLTATQRSDWAASEPGRRGTSAVTAPIDSVAMAHPGKTTKDVQLAAGTRMRRHGHAAVRLLADLFTAEQPRERLPDARTAMASRPASRRCPRLVACHRLGPPPPPPPPSSSHLGRQARRHPCVVAPREVDDLVKPPRALQRRRRRRRAHAALAALRARSGSAHDGAGRGARAGGAARGRRGGPKRRRAGPQAVVELCACARAPAARGAGAGRRGRRETEGRSAAPPPPSLPVGRRSPSAAPLPPQSTRAPRRLGLGAPAAPPRPAPGIRGWAPCLGGWEGGREGAGWGRAPGTPGANQARSQEGARGRSRAAGRAAPLALESGQARPSASTRRAGGGRAGTCVAPRARARPPPPALSMMGTARRGGGCERARHRRGGGGVCFASHNSRPSAPGDARQRLWAMPMGPRPLPQRLLPSGARPRARAVDRAVHVARRKLLGRAHVQVGARAALDKARHLGGARQPDGARGRRRKAGPPARGRRGAGGEARGRRPAWRAEWGRCLATGLRTPVGLGARMRAPAHACGPTPCLGGPAGACSSVEYGGHLLCSRRRSDADQSERIDGIWLRGRACAAAEDCYDLPQARRYFAVGPLATQRSRPTPPRSQRPSTSAKRPPPPRSHSNRRLSDAARVTWYKLGSIQWDEGREHVASGPARGRRRRAAGRACPRHARWCAAGRRGRLLAGMSSSGQGGTGRGHEGGRAPSIRRRAQSGGRRGTGQRRRRWPGCGLGCSGWAAVGVR
jgi:hypothetical protein